MPRPKKIGAKVRLTPTQRKNHELKAISKWKREKTKSFNLTLNVEKEKDIIEWLSKQPNKQSYLRELIRNDMKNESK